LVSFSILYLSEVTEDENPHSASAAHKILNQYSHKSRYHSIYTKQPEETQEASVPSFRVVGPRPKNTLRRLEQALENSK
jgi:hypothetical protein